jgi:hypothetical protein
MAMRKPAPSSSLLSMIAFQPAPRVVAERVVLVVEQIAVAALRAAPDAPAQLVQLRQPEMVGAVDDDRVGVGDVQPVLDDRGGDQHVDVAVGKAHHHILQLALGHLPMTHADGGLRRQPLDASASR